MASADGKIGPKIPRTSHDNAVSTENANYAAAGDTAPIIPMAASPDQNQDDIFF